MDSAHLEGTKSWQDVKEGVLVVVVSDQLAVDLFLVPGFRYFVQQADRVGDLGLDGGLHVSEEFHVLGFIVTSVPTVRFTVRTDLYYKSRFRHLFPRFG